jgi:hypothetical protein
MTHCESDQKSSNNAKGTGKFLVYDWIQKIHVSQQIVWIRIQFRIFRNGTVNLKSDFKILFWIEQKERDLKLFCNSKIEAVIADSGYSHEMRRLVCFNIKLKLNLFQIHFQTIQMMKVIVVLFISEWELPTWPPSIQMGVTAGIFLASILLKEMRYLVYMYRKLHGSRSINEKSHACLAKYL